MENQGRSGMLLYPGRRCRRWSRLGSCNGDELKDNREIISVIRAAMEIKRWNCQGGQGWVVITCSGLVQISVISLTWVSAPTPEPTAATILQGDENG